MPLINASAAVSSRAGCLIFCSEYLSLCPLCIRAVKALVSLRICTDSPEPSLLAHGISSQIACNDPYKQLVIKWRFHPAKTLISLYISHLVYLPENFKAESEDSG